MQATATSNKQQATHTTHNTTALDPNVFRNPPLFPHKPLTQHAAACCCVCACFTLRWASGLFVICLFFFVICICHLPFAICHLPLPFAMFMCVRHHSRICWITNPPNTDNIRIQGLRRSYRNTERTQFQSKTRT